VCFVCYAFGIVSQASHVVVHSPSLSPTLVDVRLFLLHAILLLLLAGLIVPANLILSGFRIEFL